MPLALVLALLLAVVSAAPAAAQPASADTTDDGIDVGFVLTPGAFYSPSKGFGAGGGVEIEHLVAPGTELYLEARTMQRFGRYRASFFTGDRYTSPLFAGVAGEYVANRVRAFYGLGPQTREDDKVYVHLRQTEAEVRVGWHPLGPSALLLQPVVRLLHTDVRSFRDSRDDAFLRLDAASQRTLFEAVDRPTTGVTYGLEVALDSRDRPRYASKGALVLLTGRRYDGLGDDAFRYYTGTAGLYGFVPLPARGHVLFSRALLALTRRIGDATLPFYALPVLDDDLFGAYSSSRFHGNDLLILTAGYRFPLFSYADWYGIDATLSVSAGNAYDDVFEQFAPGIAFDTDLRDEGARTRLRPAAAAGLQLVNLDRGRVVVSGQLGYSPEGFRVNTVRLVYGLRDRRPRVR